MTTTILASENEDWGFFATLRGHADQGEAWALAMQAVGRATGFSQEAVRDFLDSRHGRHFADEVANGLHAGLEPAAAIDAAVTRWMGWRIGRQTERDTGIPRGLPYLTGFVGHFEAALAD